MKEENLRKRYRTYSVPKLKKILDDEVSIYVRRLYSNWKGEAPCYTCGKVKRWQEQQCGHYVSRVYTNTRWYLPNLRVQDYSCNIMKSGNVQEFGARLDREKQGTTQMLNDLKHRPSTGLKVIELVEMIFEFKGKIKLL